MSDTFRPGLAHLVATTGERVHRAPYTGTTDQQHATSLRLMVEKIREGYKDRRIRERVGQVLHAAGIDGRKGATTRQVVGALLEYLRAGTVYVPDPVKTEYVQGAAATLCLAPGLCMRGGDCFPQGTLLLTEQGRICIENVEIGSKIWGLDTWTIVHRKIIKGRLSVTEIELASGAVVALTEDHHVFAERPVGAARITVSELRYGDYLIQPQTGGDLLKFRLRDPRVVAIRRNAREEECLDITTSDGYVYLPEHDVTVSNCDDLVVALCCLVLAAGIPCSVVKESYGADPFSGEDYQGHVLCAIKDEHGEWFYADPSTTKPVEDRRQQAVSRQFIDPLANTTLEIVGVGRPHVARVWEEQEVAGFGAVTAGTTQIPGTWTNVASNTVVAGLRYAVAVAVSAVATPAVPAWTADSVTSYFSKGGASPVTFLVEQVIAGSTNSSWIMIGLARSAGALPATSTTVNVVAVLQEQPAAAVPAPTSPTGPTTALVAPTVGSVSMGTALLWGLGIAAAGGVVWGLSRRRGGL